MKTVLLFLCLVISQLTFSQSKLAGFVTEQNSGKKPVADALIKSGGANQIRSSTTGQFVLTYQDLPAGKNVYVRAEKDGWEIVNEKELNTLIPANPNEKPLKIILCKAGTLATAKSKYYDTFEQNLLKELNRQKALNKGNEKEIVRLEEDYAKVQKQLNDLADEYSRINLDDATEKELQAIQLFKDGKYNEFIELKQSIVTEAQVDKALKNKQISTKIIVNADSTIMLYFKSQIDIAKTKILLFDFKGAEVVYKNIISKDTNNFENIAGFAGFLEDQKEYDKAIFYYKKSLKLSKKDDEIAAIQNSLGNLYIEKNDYPLAFNSYQEALKIREKLALSNPDYYEPLLCILKTNLGKWYLRKYDFPAAFNAFQKALEISKRLVIKDSSKYEPYVAEVQFNLGIWYREQKDYPSALIEFNKALEIYGRLAKTDSNTYAPSLGAAHNVLGLLYEEKGDISSGLVSFQNAMKIYERLARNNPHKHEPYLSNIYNNMGLLYKEVEDYNSALIFHNKSIKIFERLARDNHETYDHQVAMVLQNLGNVYQLKKVDYLITSETYIKSLKIYESLSKYNPETYESKVATIESNLGMLYADNDKYSLSLEYLKKALDINERLAKSNPLAFEMDFCKNLILMGKLQKLYYHADRQKEIDIYLGKAHQILPKYIESNPFAKMMWKDVNDLINTLKDISSLDLLSTIQTLQRTLNSSINNTEKIKIQNLIIENYQYLISQGFSNFANELGYSLGELSHYQVLTKKFKEAEKSAKEALNPTNFKKTEDYDVKIEWANTNLALALLFQGKYADAMKIYVALKDKPYNNATYRETFLADLEELEKAGITHPHVIKIRELLKK